MDVMADQGDPPKPDAALDELVTRLLECGAVLSQIVGHMVQFEASGRSAPGAAPIPTVAHSLIRSVIAEPTEAHSAAEIGSAALIIKAVTETISEEIFIVDPSMLSSPRRSTRPAATGRRKRRR